MPFTPAGVYDDHAPVELIPLTLEDFKRNLDFEGFKKKYQKQH